MSEIGHWQTEQHAAAVKHAANSKRQQCLLEIERELLRHSSSEDEGMQLSGRVDAKRCKTLSGENTVLQQCKSCEWQKRLQPVQ